MEEPKQSRSSVTVPFTDGAVADSATSKVCSYYGQHD
jgi:hypothetical protein